MPIDQRKPLCRPWAVLFGGRLVYGDRAPIFRTRREAREWIAISPYSVAHCTVVRVEVYVAKG